MERTAWESGLLVQPAERRYALLALAAGAGLLAWFVWSLLGGFLPLRTVDLGRDWRSYLALPIIVVGVHAVRRLDAITPKPHRSARFRHG